MATKSKVDTKALEEINGTNKVQDMSQASIDVTTLATECFQDLIALFGTTTYQVENVARQFVQSAEYLSKYKKENLDKADEEVRLAEEADDENRLNRATYIRNGIEAEYNDLLRFRKCATNAYETMVGKIYEPLPKKQAPKRTSAAERLAALQAKRGK